MAEGDSCGPESSDMEDLHDMICRRRNRLVNIIKQNDLSQLRQFIASHPPEAVIAPGSAYMDDTWSTAAAYGSPEALQMVLEVYAAAPDVVERFDTKINLLPDACRVANIDIVRFILDSHNSPDNRLPVGTVDLHQKCVCGDTPILLAAESLMHPEIDPDGEDKDLPLKWVGDSIARSHRLIHLLLDLGCSATDVVVWPTGTSHSRDQVLKSVLGFAVSRANTLLLQRLINTGADIHLKHRHLHNTRVTLQFKFPNTYDVTTLHLAALFNNYNAVKFLLDYQHQNQSTRPDLASSCDSEKRLPLHWAASGAGDPNCRLLGQQLRIAETLRLLLDYDSTGVNHVDNSGFTPLHYAAMDHAGCGCSQHAKLAISTLLECRADPKLADSSGRTILHLLGYRSQSIPIETTLLQFILSHGVDINHPENNGKTALHIFARNLRQVSAAKFFIQYGANIRARNNLWETPFHAAARGVLNPNDFDRGASDKDLMAENKIRLQDEIMCALQEAAGEDHTMLMAQPNAEGKTPRELLEETRNQWQQGRPPPSPGFGRGRGWGRGRLPEGV
ncbi:hypothetical protein FE257_001575 [Aspergillus nanangensis]|uniref:Ankyrin n=1 Tax=Aspergillus nanangensis TaxID=2582783 RepID=A0AAD4GX37_ASPNN|nr:hypothetical protein FE257_001575 [Aspergillus nanangensis]